MNVMKSLKNSFELAELFAGLGRNRMENRTFHRDAPADLEQLRAEAHGVQAGAGADIKEIAVVFEEKLLCLAAGAQGAGAPIFNRLDYDCRPQSVFADRIFRYRVLPNWPELPNFCFH